EGTSASPRRRTPRETRPHLLESEDAVHPGLLRTVDLRLREPHECPARRTRPGGVTAQPDLRRADEGGMVGQLGRRSRRLTVDRARRSDPEEGRRPGETRVRTDLHVLPAADLRAL